MLVDNCRGGEFVTAQVIDLFARRQAPISVVPEPAPFELGISDNALVDEYLRFQSNGNTRSEYARDIRQFREWTGDMFAVAELARVASSHVSDWRDYMLGTEERRPATVVRRMRSVRGLYKLAVEEYGLPRSPFLRVKLPEIGSNVQYTGMVLQDIERLAAWLREYADIRTRVVCALLLTTCMRVSEMCKARVEGLSFEGGKVLLDIVRKGGREDRVEIPRNTVDLLHQYLDGRQSGPLMLGTEGGALTRQVAWRMVRGAGDSALPHLAGKLHPHDFRHTFVSGMVKIGGVEEAQPRAGHRDVNHTMRYSHALDQHASSAPDELESMFGLSL